MWNFWKHVVLILASCCLSSSGLFSFEDRENNPMSIFWQIFGVPFIDCKTGKECFDKFIAVRPNIRLRIITNPIIDSLTGKKYKVDQEVEKAHQFSEKSLDKRLEDEIEALTLDFEQLELKEELEAMKHEHLVESILLKRLKNDTESGPDPGTLVK